MTPQRFLWTAVAFEGALGCVAVALAWLCGTWPAGIVALVAGPHLARDLTIGVLVALPLLGSLVWVNRHPLGPLRQLARVVHERVVPLFRGVRLSGLVAIALAAGIGEELLFRGFLQLALADLWGGPAGPWAGLALASLAFGLCHSLCAAYAVLATALGLLLGGLFLATGHLAAPIAAHALYDLLALVYLLADDRDRR
ncbi:MAG: CPBP family glutamic-type intramembrane protease [Pirellulaceae bacterium]|nr:CPBP family glutamic-type intramembrane protease [Pirellulaceae bacterium]